jgi:hypothetical protein
MLVEGVGAWPIMFRRALPPGMRTDGAIEEGIDVFPHYHSARQRRLGYTVPVRQGGSRDEALFDRA